MQRHARSGLETKAERPSGFDAIDVEDVTSGHDAEIAGLTDLLRQRFQDGVTRCALHRDRHQFDTETDQPRAGNQPPAAGLAL